MKAAGIREIGGTVETIDLNEPRSLKPDEVLIEVHGAGVGNWDDIVRTGGWDVGTVPPMALGVEATGRVLDVGSAVSRFRPGDDVLTHSAPLREQGAWAERLIAPEAHTAKRPAELETPTAAIFSVPALTAHEVLVEIGQARAGEYVVVNGAGGVTGGVISAVAARMGCQVIAVASSQHASRLRSYGVAHVSDYHSAEWQEEAERIAGGAVPLLVNAVRGGSAGVIGLVADRGRLVTITGDPPAAERGILITDFYVAPNGLALEQLAADFAADHKAFAIAAVHGLRDASKALADAMGGTAGGVVIDPRRQ